MPTPPLATRVEDAEARRRNQYRIHAVAAAIDGELTAASQLDAEGAGRQLSELVTNDGPRIALF